MSSHRDFHNNILAERALAPAAATADNTAYVTAIHDTARGAAHELVLITGNLADADVTTTVLVEEGDAANLSDATTVAAADLLGTTSGAAVRFDNDNVTAKIGYIGKKRYVRATITPANNTGNFFLAGAWITCGLRVGPKSTQIN